MKSDIVTKLIGLIILVFVILFGSKDIFEYSIGNKYAEIISTSTQVDSICASTSQNPKLLNQSSDLSSLIIDVLNSSINLTIVLISIFLAVFIFILGFLMNSMEKTLATSIDSIKKLEIQIQEKEKQIQIKIDELDIIEKRFKEKIGLISNVETKLEIQNEYIDRSTTYIYDVIFKLTSMGSVKDKTLIQKISTDKQILRLFSSKKEDRIAALHYFAEIGTKAHIEDIRFVSENDLDEEIRKFALRVLGRIEERESSKNEPINS